jgi:hypothetical protein
MVNERFNAELMVSKTWMKFREGRRACALIGVRAEVDPKIHRHETIFSQTSSELSLLQSLAIYREKLGG